MSLQGFIQSQLGGSRVAQSTLQSIQQLGGTFFPARVSFVLLDDSDQERFKRYGEYNGIGTIEYTAAGTNPSGLIGSARPLFTNFKQYPLLNEVVYIVNLPTPSSDGELLPKPYYISIVGLWNHPHHNAYPYEVPEEQADDYEKAGEGRVRKIQGGTTNIDLGKTFKEEANIHPITPFEGDVVVEGRFGNSIRLGSTVVDKKTNQGVNNWSEGQLHPGAPITIIRNGQDPNAPQEGWIPIEENIQNDISSAYLTSTQKINLDTKQITNFESYTSTDSKPKKVSEYQQGQILLTSQRVVVNSKTDHTLISSAKSINLSAIESINMDTTGYISMCADQIYLGGPNAKEGVLYGDTTVEVLDKLIKALETLSTNLQSVQVASFGPIPQLASAGTMLKTNLRLLNKKPLTDLVSKKTKVL